MLVSDWGYNVRMLLLLTRLPGCVGVLVLGESSTSEDVTLAFGIYRQK